MVDYVQIHGIVTKFFGGRNAISEADAQKLALEVAIFVSKDVRTNLKSLMEVMDKKPVLGP